MFSPMPLAMLAAKRSTPEAGFVITPTTPVTVPFKQPGNQYSKADAEWFKTYLVVRLLKRLSSDL